MANPIQITTTSPSRFVASSSRDMNSTVILYSENNYITFSTYVRGTYSPSSSDKFTVISKGYEYRPDLVSKKAYGTPDYWWRILEANGMSDIYEFKSGTNIKIPGNIFM